MKLQDIFFFVVLLVLLYKRNPYYFVWAGLISIVVAMPLFAKYVFFTAERLIYYAALAFLLAITFFIIEGFKNKI